MRTSARRAFTLTELLVVVAIMGLLAALSIPAMQSMGGAGKFNQTVSGIAGLLELARSQAIAQNTYAWVVFWPNTPTDGGPEIYAAAYLSNDGTDPLNWTGAVSLPGDTGPTKSLQPIAKVANYRQVGLISEAGTTLPGLTTVEGVPVSYPVATPAFTYNNFNTGSAKVNLTDSRVIQFTPSGAARVGSSLVDAIWLGLYPIKGKNVADTQHNVAGLKVNGLTGLVTVYRK